MDAIQWLLIGGPADGKTVWIKQGGRVLCEGATYQGQNYMHRGRLYRIGVLDPSDTVPSNIDNLIVQTGVRHIAGS